VTEHNPIAGEHLAPPRFIKLRKDADPGLLEFASIKVEVTRLSRTRKPSAEMGGNRNAE
jgi:hypothetical protein